MEYQKILNLLDNIPDQPPKFRTKKLCWSKWWVKKSYGTCSDNKFKTTMVRYSVCDYADACIPAKGKMTITRTGDDDTAKRLDERNKG